MYKRLCLFGAIVLAVYGAVAADAFAKGDDPFGTNLPPGLTARQIVSLVAPDRDPGLATLVGAKPWRYRPHTYIAIACFAASKEDYAEEKQMNGRNPICLGESHQGPTRQPGQVYLAMIEYTGGDAAPVLIAGDKKPLDIAVSWKYASESVDFDDPARPEEYERFDFAPYKITDTETAFGIRVIWRVGYAGGGASWGALLLFVNSGGKLVNILAQPMSHSWDLAGDWNEDGTRNRDSGYAEDMLIVLPHPTRGHHDLRVQESKGTWKQDFIWDDATGRYLPSARGAQ